MIGRLSRWIEDNSAKTLLIAIVVVGGLLIAAILWQVTLQPFLDEEWSESETWAVIVSVVIFALQNAQSDFSRRMREMIEGLSDIDDQTNRIAYAIEDIAEQLKQVRADKQDSRQLSNEEVLELSRRMALIHMVEHAKSSREADGCPTNEDEEGS